MIRFGILKFNDSHDVVVVVGVNINYCFFFSSFFGNVPPCVCVRVSNKVKVSPKRAVRQTLNMCFCCIRTCGSSLVGPLEITTPTNTHKHYFVIKRQWPNLKLKTKNVQMKTWFID